MTYKRWNDKDVEYLINARKQKVSYEEIARVLDRSTASVLMKASRIMTPEMSTNPKVPWSSEDVDSLKNMLAEGLSKKDIAQKLNRTEIAVKGKIVWLRKNEGFKQEKKSPDKKKRTGVYLIYFIEEDFYKIGITQQTLAARLSGYPDYEVLEFRWCKNWKEAYEIEAEVLSLVQKYEPLCFSKYNSGKSECFKADNIINIDSILAPKL